MATQAKWLLSGRVMIMLSVAILLIIGSSPVVGKNSLGLLRVNKELIIDASGRKVILRGLNVEFKDFKTVLSEQDIRRISGFGANVIRLVLDCRDFEPAPYQYSRISFILLDRILDWCEHHNIYVILDMHLAQGRQNLHDFVVHSRNYLGDLLDIMEPEGLHWTFWEYYSVYRGVGLYTGDPPHLVNPAALDVLKNYLKR